MCSRWPPRPATPRGVAAAAAAPLIWSALGGGGGRGALLPLASAASQCAKAAACRNLAAGSQERPVLHGTQQFANTDGTCQFGHAGIDKMCATGGQCGYTLYECACVSEERARRDLRTHKAINMAAGLIFTGFSAACMVVRFCACRRKKDTGKVSPFTAPGASGVAEEAIFTGVVAASGAPPPTCVGKPIGVGVGAIPAGRASMRRSPAEDKGRIRCSFEYILTTCLTVVVPMVTMLVGSAIFMKGFLINPEGYFNECDV